MIWNGISLRSFQFKKFGRGTPLEVFGTSPAVRSTAQTSARKACSFLYPFQCLRKRKLNKLWYFADAHTNSRNSAEVLRLKFLGLRLTARSATQTSARKASSFLYPFQRLRKRKLNGYKKLSAHYVCTQRSLWSEWRDLNSRPYGPEPYALPNCATPRYKQSLFVKHRSEFGSASRMSARSCVFYNHFSVDTLFRISLVLFTLLSQTKLRYTPLVIFDCLCNIHQFANFCNKIAPTILKIIFRLRFFGASGQNRLQNTPCVIYNSHRDGAWCSGSTWASDSHCVGSIPIAPANANTLTCEGVSFIFLSSWCLHLSRAKI